MRNGSASPTWVRSQRWGQSEGLAALGKYAFWGQSQGGLHAWAEQTGHLPGEQSKASIVPGRRRASKDPGKNLECRELEKMGSDSNLEGLGWWESWGRREGTDVSRPGVSATQIAVSHSHHTWCWAGLWCYYKTTRVDREPRSTGVPWTKQQNTARQNY